MTLEQFKALCEAYGGDIARWPDAERDAAHHVAQTSPEGRAALAEALELDAALSQSRSPAPSAALLRAVSESAPSPASAAPPARLALTAALTLAAGLGAGWLVAGGEAGEDVYAAAFGALDEPRLAIKLEDA
ncbi:MAG: hypothetical protein ACLFQ5_09635 [Oceanicaulis sp.]